MLELDARNALALGVPQLTIVTGRVPEALADLPKPDAIFVGGGAQSDGVLEAAWAALRRGGRLVVNAVTLETQALLFAMHQRHGGTLTRLSIERVYDIGHLRAFRPARPVTQLAVVKP